MTMLADALSLFAGRLVVHGTNLTGTFNVVLDVPDARLVNIRYAASVGVSVPPEPLQFANNVAVDVLGIALRRAGFSLEARRLPVDVLVVDAIDRAPTEN